MSAVLETPTTALAAQTHAMPEGFRHVVQVRFSDTDAMGHINNARFLTYLEDARVAYLTAVSGAGGADFMDAGLIVARIEIDYVEPLTYRGDEIAVGVTTTRVGGRSFTLGYVLAQGDVVAARSLSVIVAYDYGAAASRPLSDNERAILELEAQRDVVAPSRTE